MSDMKYAEAAAEIRNSVGNDGPLSVSFVEAVEVALRALEDVEIQAQVIIRQSKEIKVMRKAMNGQSEFAYLGGDLISREALIERMENVDWYSTNDKGVLHTGAANQESAYVRWKDVAEVMEGALAVEAEPVVHAHWVSAYEFDFGAGVERKTGYNCGRCGLYYIKKHNYCPDCGACMDAEATE